MALLLTWISGAEVAGCTMFTSGTCGAAAATAWAICSPCLGEGASSAALYPLRPRAPATREPAKMRLPGSYKITAVAMAISTTPRTPLMIVVKSEFFMDVSLKWLYHRLDLADRGQCLTCQRVYCLHLLQVGDLLSLHSVCGGQIGNGCL